MFFFSQPMAIRAFSPAQTHTQTYKQIHRRLQRHRVSYPFSEAFDLKIRWSLFSGLNWRDQRFSACKLEIPNAPRAFIIISDGKTPKHRKTLKSSVADLIVHYIVFFWDALISQECVLKVFYLSKLRIDNCTRWQSIFKHVCHLFSFRLVVQCITHFYTVLDA